MITQNDWSILEIKKIQIRLISAKKYKRNFIKNRYLYGKSADVSKSDDNFFFVAFNVIRI